MDTEYRSQGVTFEWDEEKARVNVQKYGVAFEEAAEVFFDPFHQTGDARVDDEDREFIIGYTFSEHLPLAVFVERSERIRLISARPTTRAERKLYEEA